MSISSRSLPDTTADDGIEPERYELFERPRYQFNVDRRDFIKAVGGGIVICLLLDEADAQQQGRRRGSRSGGNVPQTLGAWLHIDEGTSTKPDKSPASPARPKLGKTSARRSLKPWQKSCGCRPTRSRW
jgi:hypothetical protein